MIVGLNEYSAVGAARAVKALGKTDQIRMGSIDSSMEQIQYLEAGIYEALVIQKPFNMGYGCGDSGERGAGTKDREKHRLRFRADYKREYVHGGESEASLSDRKIRISRAAVSDSSLRNLYLC